VPAVPPVMKPKAEPESKVPGEGQITPGAAAAAVLMKLSVPGSAHTHHTRLSTTQPTNPPLASLAHTHAYTHDSNE
jgi:hypothetical protein